MNERIKELAEQVKVIMDGDDDLEFYTEKFAELLVQECIKQAHSVGNLRGANDDMIYGADTAAVQISKHFGVE